MDDMQDRKLVPNPAPYVVTMSPDGRECLTFAERSFFGWAAYHVDARAATWSTTWVRFGRVSTPGGDDGAFGVRQLYVVKDGDEELEATALRAIPLRRMEAAANRRQHREHLLELIPPANLVANEIPGERHIGPDWMLPPKVLDRQRRPKVHPDRTVSTHRRPDRFYEEVADLFLYYAAAGSRPAQDIAADMDVPVTTVHRWIREARSRGALPTLGGTVS